MKPFEGNNIPMGQNASTIGLPIPVILAVLVNHQQLRLIFGCMVFNAVFNSISVISRRQLHLSMLSWCSLNYYSAQYSFQATGCFPTYLTDSSERRTKHVAMTLINLPREYWPNWGSNQRPAVFKLAKLLTELWVSALIERCPDI